MPKKRRQVEPPRGLNALFFRLPIWLYRLHLGFLLGGRFLLINHIGRKSGRPRQVVVEVVRHDTQTGSYIVAAGFGPQSQWYQNLQKTPQVTIQVGGRVMPVTAEFLSRDAGGREMAEYALRHATAARELTRVMGYEVDGTPEDYRALGEELPFVAFRPR